MVYIVGRLEMRMYKGKVFEPVAKEIFEAGVNSVKDKQK